MKIKTFFAVIFSLMGTTIACDDETLPLAETGLSEHETDNLKFLREEEKLAFDVYSYAYAKYNLSIFYNISQSELSHKESVLAILEQYNIEDPVGANPPGVFVNEELQGIYNDFTSQVDKSLDDALLIGATIEDLDIRDITLLELQTENSDLKNLYSTLVCGSRNHLRAFVSWMNEGYTPVYISQSEFEAIINSNREQCSNQ